ncbi:hypothetical protein HDU96_003525, partial [Phlyctochytrium bullatum]
QRDDCHGRCTAGTRISPHNAVDCLFGWRRGRSSDARHSRDKGVQGFDRRRIFCT